MNQKKLEIIFLGENKDNFTNRVFELASIEINDVFDVTHEELEELRETNYMFLVDDYNSQFMISFRKQTHGGKVLLIVELHFENDVTNKDFYNIKIAVKNALLPLFDTCYWVLDEQIQHQTQELYSLINKAENHFRTLIIHYMTLKYGLNWWEHVPKELKNKTDRYEGYQKSLTDLNDINLDLYSFDIKDLTKIIENEYVFTVDFKINTFKNIPTEDDDKEKHLKKYIRELLKEPLNYELKQEKGFWNEFENYIDDIDEFKNKWDRLCEDRNHIAHNKVIDLNMYRIIKKNTEDVFKELDHAITKVANSEISTEERNFRNYIVNETKKLDAETQGFELLDTEDISNKFLDYIDEEILQVADDMLHFCEVLETYKIDKPEDILSDYHHTLIDASGANGDSFQLSIVDSMIYDDEGAESYIVLQLVTDGFDERYSITYLKPEMELNDSGFYDVILEESFDDSELQNSEGNIIINHLKGFINSQPDIDDDDDIEED